MPAFDPVLGAVVEGLVVEAAAGGCAPFAAPAVCELTGAPIALCMLVAFAAGPAAAPAAFASGAGEAAQPTTAQAPQATTPNRRPKVEAPKHNPHKAFQLIRPLCCDPCAKSTTHPDHSRLRSRNRRPSLRPPKPR
jgi:hypothetical protein